MDELKPTNKEIAVLIVIVFVFLLVVGGTGYLLGVAHARKDVHDNGNGIGEIGNQLTEAGTNISNAKDGINQAAGTADKIGSGIKDAKDTAAYIEGTANTSAELIRQCEQIISNIRRRGKT